MIGKFIEAAHPVTDRTPVGGNWGKFLLIRFDSEWEYQSALPAMEGRRLMLARGWAPGHILFVDLETGEGTMLRPGGSASADLNKHAVWVCPMAEPFLEWLYAQDLADLSQLPSYVELPEAPFAMAGHRRQGPQERVQELEAALKDIIETAEKGDCEGDGIPAPVAAAIAHAGLVLNQAHEYR